MRAPVLEVEDGFRVDCIAHETCFEVKVWTGASASVAGESDWLTSFHVLVRLHKEAREVTINCFKAVFVTNDYIEAVATAFVFCEADASAECCIDGIANGCADVNTLVHAFEARAITVRRGYHCLFDWHHIVLNIDALAVGHCGFFVRIYQAAFPTFGVDVRFWFNVFPEFLGILLAFFEVDSFVNFRLACKFVGVCFAVT